MYAVIKSGSKQYRVKEGDEIDVELLASDPGTKIQFAGEQILFAYDGSKAHVGQPNIPNFIVSGEIIGTVPGKKTRGLKYKASHNQCRQWGHRQKYTRVKITGIEKKSKEKHHGT